MHNPFNMKTNNFIVEDCSKGVRGIEGTVEVGNTYQDLMGFGELWVINKIEFDEVYLVSITNQFRPVVVITLDEGFLLRFARRNIKKEG